MGTHTTNAIAKREIPARRGWAANLKNPLVWAGLLLAIAALIRVVFPELWTWVSALVAGGAAASAVASIIWPVGRSIKDGEIPARVGYWWLVLAFGIVVVIGYYVAQFTLLRATDAVTLPVLPLYLTAVTAAFAAFLELLTNDWRADLRSFIMKETQAFIVAAGAVFNLLAAISIATTIALTVLGLGTLLSGLLVARLLCKGRASRRKSASKARR